MGSKFKIEGKKFALTVLFSVLYALRILTRPFYWTYYHTGFPPRNEQEFEFIDRYHDAIQDIDLHACIDSGLTESACRTQLHVLS